MPTAAAITHSVNSSREPVRATCHNIHGNARRPTISMNATNSATLPSVTPNVVNRSPLSTSASAPSPPSHPDKRRQQHEHQHHHEVFHHQPADGDVTVDRFELAAAFERPQQHHRARHRQRQTEHDAGAEVPSPPRGRQRAERRRHADLRDGAGQRDAAHLEQILRAKSAGRRRTSAASRRSRRAAATAPGRRRSRVSPGR